MKRYFSSRRSIFSFSLFAFVLCTACSGGGGGGGSSPTVPGPTPEFPAITLTPVVSGAAQPVGVYHAGDGSGRLFIVEQVGRVRIVRDGAFLPAPFLDISGQVLAGGERGLLGLAFPPGFPQQSHFYVNYTRSPDGATVVSRFFLSPEDPDIALATGEEVLLLVAQPAANHNAGQLAFGPDGFLYVALGDGGGANDQFQNAQNRGTLFGNLLRLDVEAGIAPYAVPAANPFVGEAGVLGEIWAYGLRNPWRFSFDRATGDLFIADVGQNLVEEVNFQPVASTGGENYGWNIMEGTSCFLSPGCDQTGLTLPVAEYRHGAGDCSVTGGFVYRGAEHPTLQGIYFYADFCSGRLWGLRRNGTVWQNRLLLDTPLQISSFGEDEAGNLHVVDFGAGDIYKIDLLQGR
jgi:glucose/arabinose dehydrogenase